MSETANIEYIQRGPELERCPFPIPFGWYVMDLSENLEKGDVRNIKALSSEWVIFRTEGGHVGVVDPYCPHLGAHLGHGGKIVGDNLQCPFHNWEFDHEGWCKKIPYGKVMPGIAKKKPVLQALPVQEKYGLIWAWYHPEGEAPSFDVPDVREFMEDGHVPVRRGCWDISTCLQELGENSVDTPHLKFLHGAPIIPDVEANIDDKVFHFNILDGYIVGEVHGPGAQIVRHSTNGVSVLMFSTPLPLDEENTRVRMHFTFKDYPEGSEERATAEHLYSHSIGEAEGEESKGFAEVDLLVWDNKKYRPNPLLCDGDGPIMLWREYYNKFYREPKNQ